MTQKSAHPTKAGSPVLNVESRPYSELPGQSRLFLDYQTDPLSLKHFFPAAVESHADVRQHVATVLQNFTIDREILCDALLEENRSFSASGKTFANIEKLRHHDCVTVVTGQQAGCFLGPLYTIYKGLSAIKLSNCLQGMGVNAVPVFWVASEDHDFEEVSKALILNADDKLFEIVNRPAEPIEDLPVGRVILDRSIKESIALLTSSLPSTEFTNKTEELLASAWVPGRSYSHSFSCMISSLFADHGLIVIDPLSGLLKHLAAPIYSLAIERSAEIKDAILSRNEELRKSGYHPQVKVDSGYFPMFWHDESGRRKALKFTTRKKVVTKDRSHEFSVDKLKSMAEHDPTRFSPSALLRPVVQDFLFPTVCYFGGSAEIAYFAQNSVVYEMLDRPVTTILHRQSYTVIEPKVRRVLDTLGFKFNDLFDGLEELRLRAAKENLAKDSAKLFDDVERKIDNEIDRLREHVAASDDTLASSLSKRRRKMLYHISAIRERFFRSQIRKDETLDRRIEMVFSHLLPDGQLQERVLNISYFLDLYGTGFIDWLYESIDLNDRGHRLISL